MRKLSIVLLLILSLSLLVPAAAFAQDEDEPPSSSSSSDLESVGKATVATEWFNANLRAGPGSSHPVIANAPPGASLEMFARAGDWFYVKTHKTRGWVWSGLIALDKGLDLDDVPIWASETDEEIVEGEDDEEVIPGAFDAWWNMLDARFDSETQRATHTIALSAQGGSGEYKFYADDEELTNNVFDVTTHLCATQIIMARVTDTEGHEETLPIYFQTYCPKPWE